MALDSRFVIASDLQSHFVDKDSGLPLTGGTITFYKDQARTTPKDVYILDNGPPYSDSSYIKIGNTVTLGPGGNIMYLNNDVILYYFPYDGDAQTSNNNSELYYVTIYNQNSVLQKTLSAWPNTNASGSSSGSSFINYIPNGQFIVHNNIPATNTIPAGQINSDITQLAAGGWYFVRESGSTATDSVTFVPINSDTSVPGAGARFWVRINRSSTGSDPGDLCDLRIKFPNVNTFSSETGNATTYSLAVFAQNNVSSTVPVEVILIKYMGTGGTPSTEIEIPVGTLNISNNDQYYQLNGFSFGNNSSYTFGTGGDYVEIALRFPPDDTNDFQLTNFILTDGNTTITSFPTTTEAQSVSQSVAGWLDIPDYDGANLYLTPILTIEGMTYDTDSIGDVIAESGNNTYTNSLSTTTNRMIADGGQYQVTGYSPLGIPYRRLFNKYYSNSLKVPIWGTGLNFMTCVYSGTGSILRFVNNSSGPVTDASDGSSPHATGFTFNTIHKITSPATNYYTNCFLVASSQFYLQNKYLGAVGATGDGTGGLNTGFTISTIQTGSTLLKNITSITTTDATSLAGKYFFFESMNSNNGSTQPFFVWYTVNGSGSLPSVPGYVAILVKLDTGDSAAIVAQKTQEALNGWQETEVTVAAASTLSTSDYFNINTISTAAATIPYYIWYQKDGAGSDPAPGGTGIKVNILSADTADIVASKTQIAVNQTFFAVPNYQGAFLRGLDNGAGIDPEASARWSLVPGISGDILGTFQLDEYKSHVHPPLPPMNSYVGFSDTVGFELPNGNDENNAPTTGPAGSYEVRPFNANVRYVIKY